MSTAINLGQIVNATTGAVDAASTQGSIPSSINSAQLIANITAWAGTAASLIPGSVAQSIGALGQGAAGVGLGISLAQLATANNAADKASAGLSALGAVAGLIASNPFVPPQVRLGMLAAQAAFTGIAGVISRDPRLVNDFIEELGNINDFFWDVVSRMPRTLNDLFNSGLRWTVPRDPLVLDLDGDGVELTNSSSSVLFDHNADGILTGTQWVRGDDGLLVMDLNGNGTIDSGRELFGDQTRIGDANGNPQIPLLARNGFQALRKLDLNQDNLIDAQDAAFGQLKVWQDSNQDGTSQAPELKTLAELGITHIKLGGVVNTGQMQIIGGTPHPVMRDERGEATGQNTFTINGDEQTVKNIDFTTNSFFSKFTDNPPVTQAASGLPQMQGSGLVRGCKRVRLATKSIAGCAVSIGARCRKCANRSGVQRRRVAR